MRHVLVRSGSFARDPVVSRFLVFALHRSPGDAVGGSFALVGTPSFVLGPGVIEGGQVDLLSV